MLFDNILNWIDATPYNGLLFLIGLFVLAWVFYFIVQKIVLKMAARLILKTRAVFDDYILKSKALERFSLIVPVLVLYNIVYFFPQWKEATEILTGIAIAIIVSRSLTALLNGLTSYYGTLEIARTRPIKGYVQIVNLIIYLVAFIFIIGLLTGESPWELLAGLGALTAVLLLIFRDTILSFVASLQIAGNDLVHVGDWIEMPKFGADGDVIDIALHTIKVQNWDKTITVIPTYKIIDESFKNWRGMTASGGRRIKRALFIDINSVGFCSDEMVSEFEKIDLIAGYINEKRKELSRQRTQGADVNSRRLTNVGTFRVYAEKYVKNHPGIHPGLTCMVRQLSPGPHGVPLEIYAFTNTVEWQAYEAIQSDIFDHLFAVISEFGLRIYQQPAGTDMAAIQFVPEGGASAKI